MKLINRMIDTLLPYSFKAALSAVRILESDYGHFRSARTWSCIDRNGEPIPWYTYPATEYIRQFDIRDKTVFEYGSGNSTLFWSRLAQEVISIEDDSTWFSKMCPQVDSNVTLTLAADADSYVNHLAECQRKFDIIVVDGSQRKRCAEEALKWLKPGGMIILDNADWFVQSAAILRAGNLIEVDMTGFSPINGYTLTTTFFLDRQFSFLPKHTHQPHHGIGAIRQYAKE